MGERARRDEGMSGPTEFHVVDPAQAQGPRLAALHALGEREVRTLEGKLAGSWLARAHPVAWAYAGLLTLAELSTLVPGWGGRLGTLLHTAILFTLVTHASLVRRLNPLLARFLVAMGPVPLIRIVSLTSPLMQFSYIQWFTVIAVILY